jgi:hypothetical protein
MIDDLGCDIPTNNISGNVTPRLFHGGVPGLAHGERIRPGHQDLRLHADCPTCQANARGEHGPWGPPTPPDRVYGTTDRQYARWYASLVGLGWLYRVRPIGELHESTEDHFPSFWADEFEVVSVLERAVRLTWRERRRLYIRWGGNETEWRAMLAHLGVAGVR